MARRGVVALLLSGLVMALPAQSAGAESVGRVVSMNPSLTAILLALDAGELLVGVEEHSLRLHPQVADLPSVGGLFNPSLEAVVALEPDLVVLVPSAEQRDFRGRLGALGVEVLALPNITLEEILASIEILGERVGRVEAARQRVREIRRAREEVMRATAEHPAVRAVVVLQRDPLYVVGRGSFLDDMLRISGAHNIGAEFDEPYPRAGEEWMIAAAPEVILDSSDPPPDPASYWSRWPSIPAVAGGRALALPPSVTVPGPYLDRSLRLVVELLHRPGILPRAPER